MGLESDVVFLEKIETDNIFQHAIILHQCDKLSISTNRLPSTAQIFNAGSMEIYWFMTVIFVDDIWNIQL